MIAISADRLSKKYKRNVALNLATFEIPKGSVAALVGKNGAGKSTLLHVLAGLAKVDSGHVTVNGSSPSQNSTWLSQIGFVDQVASLPSQYSLKKLSRLGSDLNTTWNDELLFQRSEQLEISPDRRVENLSGGQKHAVAVLLALAKEPAVVLLDEPLASLDPISRRTLLGIFLSHAYENASTILLSSHLVGDLERACDHIVLLSKGSVLLSHSIDEVVGAHFWVTNSHTTKALLDSLMVSPLECWIELDSKLLVCTSNAALVNQLDAKPAGLEEIVIARMTGSSLYRSSTNTTEAPN